MDLVCKASLERTSYGMVGSMLFIIRDRERQIGVHDCQVDPFDAGTVDMLAAAGEQTHFKVVLLASKSGRPSAWGNPGTCAAWASSPRSLLQRWSASRAGASSVRKKSCGPEASQWLKATKPPVIRARSWPATSPVPRVPSATPWNGRSRRAGLHSRRPGCRARACRAASSWGRADSPGHGRSLRWRP